MNSISVSNGADGVYPVWVGVDKFNKVRKIFASTNGGSFYDWDRDGTKKLVSWSFNKRDLNDQYFFSGISKTFFLCNTTLLSTVSLFFIFLSATLLFKLF